MSRVSETAGIARQTGAEVLEALSSAAISLGEKRGVRWQRVKAADRTVQDDEYAVSMGFVGDRLRGEFSVAVSESAVSALWPGRSPTLSTAELADGLAQVLRAHLEGADEPVRLSVPLVLAGVHGLARSGPCDYLFLVDGDRCLECRVRIEQSDE